ncbi:MAG: DEAD/DEAH box helicase family protein [Proteobacteria bacterium]|nr:DEAD/DEAH box helicase family protein [Pseudomonadota bacterium]
MILRKRQQEFVQKSVAALKEHGNTVAIAPTGAGKTLMLSAVVGKVLEPNSKALILAHRDELTSQNEKKFLRINPKISTSVFDAKRKSFAGQAVFAMVQTLSRKENLELIPAIHLLVIDEGHHCVSPSYRNIINEIKEKNPSALIYGVTATPNRGDKKDLGAIFSNVADQITISELVASGHLVRPRTYIIDVGAQSELKNVKKTAGDFDMKAVEEIMNKFPITEEVFAKWQELAGNRKTVIFCSTIAHAKSVAKVFNSKGVKTVFISGELSDEMRKSVLSEFEQGDAQVIVNVAVLTEGWDYQPTSCVILLRPSSFKSTMIQMIGRGLRVVDNELYPDVIKEDCIVLDFGTSSLIHGSLEVDVDLEKAKQTKKKPEPRFQKQCPSCSMLIPSASNSCPLCDYEFVINSDNDSEKEELSGFSMSEIDLLTERSNFQWCNIFDDNSALMASGFNAFSGVFFLNDHWYAVGGTEFGIKVLSAGSREICLAQADDFLNENETADNAYKTKRWLNEIASTRQLQCLPQEYRSDYSITKYKAANNNLINSCNNSIQKLLFEADAKRHAGGSA